MSAQPTPRQLLNELGQHTRRASELRSELLRAIREARTRRHISQATIARRLDISRDMYANYETGRRRVPPDILAAMVDFFGGG